MTRSHPPFFVSLDEHRVTAPEWRVYEVVTDVPQHAAAITYGLFLAGVGTAWLDAVSLEVVGD
jgi:hypothetical protein